MTIEVRFNADHAAEILRDMQAFIAWSHRAGQIDGPDDSDPEVTPDMIETINDTLERHKAGWRVQIVPVVEKDTPPIETGFVPHEAPPVTGSGTPASGMVVVPEPEAQEEEETPAPARRKKRAAKKKKAAAADDIEAEAQAEDEGNRVSTDNKPDFDQVINSLVEVFAVPEGKAAVLTLQEKYGVKKFVDIEEAQRDRFVVDALALREQYASQIANAG